MTSLNPVNSVKQFPLLPLRDVVMFPYMVAPLFVGRERSIKALEEAMKGKKRSFFLHRWKLRSMIQRKATYLK